MVHKGTPSVTVLAEAAGLSPSEAAVYLALVENGPSSSGPLIRTTGLPNSVVYRALDHLAEQSLVGVAVVNKVKRFSAAPPTRLLDWMDAKKAEAAEILASISQTQAPPGSSDISVWEGPHGTQNVWNDTLLTLQKGDTVYVLGAPPRDESLNRYFQKYHARRAKLGISYKILFKQNAANIARQRAHEQLTEVRLLPRDFESPVWIGVYLNKAVIGTVTKTPRLIVINDAEVARSYLQYFNYFWKRSKKV